MTVTYTHEVANARLGAFSSLLLRWRGSVYKLFYKEFAIYITLYTILSLCYRRITIPEFRDYFEKLCLQFESYTDLVPISFVLGFYVSMVVGRWWQMFLYIPWPDRIMMIVTANVHGPDNRGRLIRRTLMRYLSLAQVLTYRSISTAVFKRFPTMQHVIDAGFMTLSEYKQYENLKTENAKYFVPCLWFSNLLSKVRQEGRIYDDMTYQNILKELNDFRGCCGMLFSYDWISIPLVYTQVVTVAVYVFFMSTLLGRQYLDVAKHYDKHDVDLYVPIFTIFQFFFYVGWLKVAEQLINPFGEDDDDFEANFIIDRNHEISMYCVDNMYLSHPKLEKDLYWNEPKPSIPYTAAAANHKLDAFLGSTIDMSLHREEMQFVEQPQPQLGSRNDHYLDVNHNYVGIDDKTRLQPPPPYTVPKQAPTRAPNPVNFWKRVTGRDKENEMKKSLLEKDFLSGRRTPNIKVDNLVKEEKDDDDENETSTPETDDDSSESDVGDGGGSEDDGSEDNKSSRRSSISSGDDKDETEDPQQSSSVRKHSLGEPGDRPRAKKPKNSLIPNPKTTELRPERLKAKATEKIKRPDKLMMQNFSEGNLKNMRGRFSTAKSKKSPKKANATKFPKRNDFQRNKGTETEEDRKNAQTRTISLLKSAKRKSVQALQRNARRTNYPGNAWLRSRYPPHFRSDLFIAADYASMTSGAEDHKITEHDSPFGSIISFGTSIPSPRPLRFSQFGRRGKRKHFDSVSMSSCMTSPCANEDFSPSFGSVSMPFTEDLRRRLLVVNPTNTPSSSVPPSPLLARSYSGHGGFYFPNGQDSDDLLMIASTSRTSAGTTWENTLEAIGEAGNSLKPQTKSEEKSATSDIDANRPIATGPTQENEMHKTENKNAATATKDTQNLSQPSDNHDSSSHRPLARSSSCPVRPSSRIPASSSVKFNTLPKQSSGDEPVSSKEHQIEESPTQSSSTISTDKRSLLAQSLHRENKVVGDNGGEIFKYDFDIPRDEKSTSEAPYIKLTKYSSGEFTPLLQEEDADEIERLANSSDAQEEERLLEDHSGDGACEIQETYPPELPENSAPDRGHKHRRSAVSDFGYYSSKEESEKSNIADPLAKLRSFSNFAQNQNGLGLLSGKLSENTVTSETVKRATEIEDKVPDCVVIPISSSTGSGDVIIDIT